ncbi:MAG: DUF805 domain-containing protein [Maribacter sp.]|uniref:DUF805 domain-containing protein n=1 Tax=Maribacter sp. TaxID=1897614 RepID=UPI003298FB9D
MKWYLKVLKQYADFNGRARRQEYWMFALFNIVIIIALAFLSGMLGSATNSEDLMSLPVLLYYLVIIIPSIAVAVRRLHDQNKSGWYYLVTFIPFIGGIWLLVLMCTEGDSGPNQYGPDPKNPNTEINDIGVTEV